MTVGEYAFGIVWLAVLLAVLAFGARRIVRCLCPGWSGPLAWLAGVSTATAMLVVASELAGLLGGFTRPGLIVAAGALSAIAAIASRRISLPALPAPPSPVQPRWLVALAVLASLATAAVWVAPTLQSLDVGMYRQDSTWYHLTFSADFFQSGHVGGVHFTDPMSLAAWFYPQNSELLHGVGMVAFGSDFLSPLLNLGLDAADAVRRLVRGAAVRGRAARRARGRDRARLQHAAAAGGQRSKQHPRPVFPRRHDRPAGQRLGGPRLAGAHRSTPEPRAEGAGGADACRLRGRARGRDQDHAAAGRGDADACAGGAQPGGGAPADGGDLDGGRVRDRQLLVPAKPRRGW